MCTYKHTHTHLQDYIRISYSLCFYLLPSHPLLSISPQPLVCKVMLVPIATICLYQKGASLQMGEDAEQRESQEQHINAFVKLLISNQRVLHTTVYF